MSVNLLHSQMAYVEKMATDTGRSRPEVLRRLVALAIRALKGEQP